MSVVVRWYFKKMFATQPNFDVLYSKIIKVRIT